jgi:ADP-glucose pyrophosphorylase
MLNSGIHLIYFLVQYKSQSLIDHIRRSWVLSPILPEQFVTDSGIALAKKGPHNPDLARHF